MEQAQIGLIGLAVMGENLAMNLESKGFTVAVYNRELDWVSRFVEGRGAGKRFLGCTSLRELVSRLEKPRKILMMVRAGEAVDQLMEGLIPLLEPGDVLMDGGNSNFQDTGRRAALMESHGLLYVGAGVSGGEEGALRGPSIMPGGSAAAWPLVAPILQSICAKVNGEPCCDWVGSGGSGHFVKMVHNGIEYGDMQLICEVYQLMRDLLGMTPDEMAGVFAEWNRGELSSYLVEITAEILSHREPDGQPTVDRILDAAGQKGTGKWTGIAALEEGVPLTLIAEAVFARCLSAAKEERVGAAALYPRSKPFFAGDRAAFLEQLRQALYAAKIVSYAQGFALMRAAGDHYGWSLNFGGVAMMWRGGCIIRSAFLGNIRDAFAQDPALNNLLLAPYFREAVDRRLPAWREVAATALREGVPAPALCTALSYFDGYTCEHLPANLLQAQRDYFGAHSYERVDRPRGEFFHTDWTGQGGATASGSYTV